MSSPAPIVTRFAPSPTGLLHLGNARTALFNFLMARACAGRFLLRVEDTDSERSTDEYVDALMRDLRWLGIDWDEGPDCGGPHEPYRQSRRGAVYARYFDELARRDLAYPCYCSPEELAFSRKAQRAAGQAPKYAGTCAHLTRADIEKREAQGRTPTLRFRVPTGKTIVFEDSVRGAQRFLSDDIGDFIIRKADGGAAFFFCNAVDDALMGVTHVLRGEDHLANTPRQMMLLEALGLPAPTYGHISLVLGHDGAPLSKRNGSRALADLREEGWLGEAVVNHLARLGHSFAEEEGYLSMNGVATRFDANRLVKPPARHDEHQLVHWQKEGLLRLAVDELAAILAPLVADTVPADALEVFAAIIRENIIMPADAVRWAHKLFDATPDCSEEAKAVIIEAGAKFFATALATHSPEQDWKTFSKSVGKAAGVKGKALFMPLRAALTGEVHGPQMADVYALIGTEAVRTRLEAAYYRCLD